MKEGKDHRSLKKKERYSGGRGRGWKGVVDFIG
jgi:hypothetical protein